MRERIKSKDLHSLKITQKLHVSTMQNISCNLGHFTDLGKTCHIVIHFFCFVTISGKDFCFS